MEGMSSEGGKLNGIPTARRCFGGVISLSIGSSLLTPAIHRSVHSAHAPCARLRVLLWRSGPGTGGAMKQIEENSMTDTSVTVLGLQFTVQLSYFCFFFFFFFCQRQICQSAFVLISSLLTNIIQSVNLKNTQLKPNRSKSTMKEERKPLALH